MAITPFFFIITDRFFNLNRTRIKRQPGNCLSAVQTVSETGFSAYTMNAWLVLPAQLPATMPPAAHK
jgi:hypothetical protein